MEKNKKEKQMVLEWGMNNYSKDIFEQSDDRKESYFRQRSDDFYLREYKFETLPDFMEEINELWKNDEIIESIKKVIGVAAMKNKPGKADEIKEQGKNQAVQEEKLPAFIYNF